MRTPLNQIKNWPARAKAAKYKPKRLAKACGVCLRQLQRYFHSKWGKTPRQWMNDLRLGKALPLLKAGCSVKEAARSSGYAQPHHFSDSFNRFQGKRPSSI